MVSNKDLITLGLCISFKRRHNWIDFEVVTIAGPCGRIIDFKAFIAGPCGRIIDFKAFIAGPCGRIIDFKAFIVNPQQQQCYFFRLFDFVEWSFENKFAFLLEEFETLVNVPWSGPTHRRWFEIDLSCCL